MNQNTDKNIHNQDSGFWSNFFKKKYVRVGLSILYFLLGGLYEKMSKSENSALFFIVLVLFYLLTCLVFICYFHPQLKKYRILFAIGYVLLLLLYIYFVINNTTDIFMSEEYKDKSQTTIEENSKTKDTLKPKSTEPCEKPDTIKFDYGEPNRIILVFAGNDCTGELVAQDTTDSEGYCSIIFTNGCNEKHTVRVYSEIPLPRDYIASGLCESFYPVNVNAEKITLKVKKRPLR